jgi:hypothetical protein
MAGDNPFSYGSASWSKLGSDSPFKGATGIGQTDWGSMGSTDYWKGGFDVDKSGTFGSGPSPFGGGSSFDWKRGADFLGGFISKMSGSDQDKYRSKYESMGPRMLGPGMAGRAGQVLENLGVVYPQQHGPIFIPGVQEGKGTGQRIAGGLSGALQGAATGAALGPIGAIGGALIGGFGGAMG